MKQIKVKISLLFFIGIGLKGLFGQEIIPSAGKEVSDSGGSISYTIGQIVCNTNIGTNGSEAQGVQQPYEIMVISGIDQVKCFDIYYVTYPNPTSDFLILKANTPISVSRNKLTYKLFTNKGTLLESKKIAENETSISLGSFVPETYFLKIIENSKEIQTIKIIKN